MKDTVIYAKYNHAGNKSVYKILSAMPREEREKERGNYYGSLSGIFRHILGGTWFFMSLFKGALKNNAAASKAVSEIEPLQKLPEGALNDEQWKALGVLMEKADAAYITMAEALSEADLALPVEVEWYGGNPASAPLSFMLSQLLVHNTHHRGQISQALDSLKIENDFSGIDISALN